jgi:hypothetical protein
MNGPSSDQSNEEFRMTNQTNLSEGSEASINQELTDGELDAVTGGSVVDTVVGVATQIWKIITSPAPSGVKGEALDKGHRDWTD